MTTFISFLTTVSAILIAVPVAVFFIEVMAATALPQRGNQISSRKDFRPFVAILVPAHNESANLLPTLTDIKAQMRAGDRLLVVADNCTDDTAAIAAAAGAEVTERNDPERRGKGYALDWGVRHLGTSPDIVIVFDADCRLAACALDRLAKVCAMTHRPVQALYLLNALDESPINSRVAEFAWRVKNWVRPLGLKALGLPCQLLGSGMAFPWDLIRSADLATGQIVEDLKLGADLALAGTPPIFCPFAGVTSYFPFSDEGARSQRQRWERGHLGMIGSAAPKLIVAGILRANLDLLALALDLSVPPLTLLGVLVTGVWMVACLETLFGISSMAILVSSVSFLTFIGTVFLSWLTYGNDILPPRSLWLIPHYLVGKLPIYRRMLFRKLSSDWIRTDRSKF